MSYQNKGLLPSPAPCPPWDSCCSDSCHLHSGMRADRATSLDPLGSGEGEGLADRGLAAKPCRRKCCEPKQPAFRREPGGAAALPREGLRIFEITAACGTAALPSRPDPEPAAGFPGLLPPRPRHPRRGRYSARPPPCSSPVFPRHLRRAPRWLACLSSPMGLNSANTREAAWTTSAFGAWNHACRVPRGSIRWIGEFMFVKHCGGRENAADRQTSYVQSVKLGAAMLRSPWPSLPAGAPPSQPMTGQEGWR